jgi:hypothetical protein
MNVNDHNFLLIAITNSLLLCFTMDMDVDSDVDPRIACMSYRELQAKCKELGIPAKGRTEELQQVLNDYFKDPVETLKRAAKEGTKKKNGRIDWKKSAAREILLEDLEPPKGWLYGVDNLDAKLVYDYYKHRHEEIFELVPFAQFKTRYHEAIKIASKRRSRSAEEEAMLNHDRGLHPRQTHNHRGEPVFDMDVMAKAQLSEDIQNNLHKRLTPMELWQSREVYSKYQLKIFRHRIYQYTKRVKFLNWLEKQRNEKRDEFAAKRRPKEFTFVRSPATHKADTAAVAKSLQNRAGKIRAANGHRKRCRSENSSGSKKQAR